jgi:hypothetical protein
VDAVAGAPDFDALSRQPGLGERGHGFGPAVGWGHKSGHRRNVTFSRTLLRILAAAFVTAAVTLDKQRAKSVLSLLTAIAALIAAEPIGYDLGYLRLPGYEHLGERADAINYRHDRIHSVLCDNDPHLRTP